MHLHTFSQKLGELILSEFSSDEETTNERDKVFPGVYLLDVNEEQIENFLDLVMGDESLENKRLLGIYNCLDVHRNEKWKK